MQNVVTNANGMLQSVTGPVAVSAFQYRAIISMLKLEAKGIRFKVSALKAAKHHTKLKTNDRAKHIAALTVLMDAALAQCTIVDASKG